MRNQFTSQGLSYCLGNITSCLPSHQAHKAYRTNELEDSRRFCHVQKVKSFVFCGLLSVRLIIVLVSLWKVVFRESIKSLFLINILTTKRKKETGHVA